MLQWSHPVRKLTPHGASSPAIPVPRCIAQPPIAPTSNMSKSSRPYLRDLQFRGVIEGLTHLDDKSKPQCHFFGGVPFGLPPVGPFRFQKPRSLPTCYRYGTKSNPGRFTGSCGLCPQSSRQGLDDGLWEEDCLQSNIWVPADEPPKEGTWPSDCRYHGG